MNRSLAVALGTVLGAIGLVGTAVGGTGDVLTTATDTATAAAAASAAASETTVLYAIGGATGVGLGLILGPSIAFAYWKRRIG